MPWGKKRETDGRFLLFDVYTKTFFVESSLGRPIVYKRYYCHREEEFIHIRKSAEKPSPTLPLSSVFPSTWHPYHLSPSLFSPTLPVHFPPLLSLSDLRIFVAFAACRYFRSVRQSRILKSRFWNRALPFRNVSKGIRILVVWKKIVKGWEKGGALPSQAEKSIGAHWAFPFSALYKKTPKNQQLF